MVALEEHQWHPGTSKSPLSFTCRLSSAQCHRSGLFGCSMCCVTMSSQALTFKARTLFWHECTIGNMTLRKCLLQDCIFLKGKECTVHAAKPLQCRTYPWWPELMHPDAWNEENMETCEGLDHEDGVEDPLYAAQQLKLATEHYEERACAVPSRKSS